MPVPKDKLRLGGMALAAFMLAIASASWWYLSGGPQATLRGHDKPVGSRWIPGW